MNGALCGVSCMVSANVRMVKGIASGFGVDCESVGRLLGLPFLDKGVDGINPSVLGN